MLRFGVALRVCRTVSRKGWVRNRTSGSFLSLQGVASCGRWAPRAVGIEEAFSIYSRIRDRLLL